MTGQREGEKMEDGNIMKLNNNESWIRTYSGGKVYFFEPEKSEIEFEDISHSLSMLCRFNGATKEFYSVANHSCIVAENIYKETGDKNLAYCGLMHDAHEAFVSDIPSPFKKQFPEFVKAETRFELWLSARFNYTPFLKIVKKHDIKALATEMRDLMRIADYSCLTESPYDDIIIPLFPKEAKNLFVETYQKFKP